VDLYPDPTACMSRMSLCSCLLYSAQVARALHVLAAVAEGAAAALVPQLSDVLALTLAALSATGKLSSRPGFPYRRVTVGYSGIRGAVGLGHRFTVQAYPATRPK
jgi:hypothetical protein